MSETNAIWKTIKDFARDEKVSIKTIYNRIESGNIKKERIKKVLGIMLIKA